MFTHIDFHQIFLLIVPLVFAVTIHEYGHGYAAFKLGDDTASRAGRLTLNPLKHMDPFGSFILPLLLKLTGSPILFGYAKPVPVNFSKLRPRRAGTMIVSATGIAANLACAFLSGAIFRILILSDSWGSGFGYSPILMDVMKMLEYSVIINCVLAIFNMIPIPPLDGSKIFAMLLPSTMRTAYFKLERFGIVILMILIISGSGFFRTIMVFFLEPLANFFLGV